MKRLATACKTSTHHNTSHRTLAWLKQHRSAAWRILSCSRRSQQLWGMRRQNRLGKACGLVQVGRYGPEEFDFSRERVTASVSESLQRLQVCFAGQTALMHSGISDQTG